MSLLDATSLRLPEAAAVAPRGSAGVMAWGDYAQLLKPRITLLVGVIAWLGFHIGAWAYRGTPNLPLDAGWAGMLLTVFGATLSCMGAAALNQVYEKDTDAKMERTRNRPLPTGRIGQGQATRLGLGLAGLGVAALAVVDIMPALLSAATVAGYVLIYTPMKRRTSLATIVGAVPGALPPVIGYAGATGRIDVRIMVMFAIMFLWQLPHFLAIAWLYRRDYAKAGMPMLSVTDPSGWSNFGQAALSCLALLPLALLPSAMRLAGPWCFMGSLAAGLMFLGACLGGLAWRNDRWARAMFLTSLVHLPAVFGLLAWDAR